MIINSIQLKALFAKLIKLKQVFAEAHQDKASHPTHVMLQESLALRLGKQGFLYYANTHIFYV